MSIKNDILDLHPDDISAVTTGKSDIHGEEAIEVVVHLNNGKVVTGLFTKHSRAGFGGVEFSGPKDIVGLMSAKIDSVLKGTAE